MAQELSYRDRNLKLIHRAQAGDKSAREQLIRLNEGLIHKYLPRYLRMWIGNGIDAEDLEQAGRIGLALAIDRFDPNLGTAFSTYASCWIQQVMQRCQQTGAATIRYPALCHAQVIRSAAVREALLITLGRAPTREELAQAARLTPEQLKMIEGLPTCSVSLDAPLAQHSETTLRDTLENPEAHLPTAQILETEWWRDLIQQLIPLHQEVLRQRFFERRTLREIAGIHGKSFEMVRLYEKAALTALRQLVLAQMERDRLALEESLYGA